MKKAQVIGEVFVFILASAVFVLIIAYGYSAISKVSENQEDILLLDLKTTLESSSERIMLSYGSVEKLDIRLPKQYQKICFATDKALNGVTMPTLTTLNSALMLNAWKTGDENVFLLPKQKTPIKIKDIAVVNGACCIKPNGQFSLRLEGKGRYAEVTTWDETIWPCIT